MIEVHWALVALVWSMGVLVGFAISAVLSVEDVS